MAKRGLDLGQWGSMSLTSYVRDAEGKLQAVPGGRGASVRWRARTRVRDLDGVRRDVEVWEGTRSAAQAALLQVLQDRTTPSTQVITSRTTVQALADIWLADVERRVESGKLAPATLDAYRRAAHLHVLPAMRGLRISELSHSLIQGVLEQVAATVGPDAAKHARSCLSSMVKVAMSAQALRSDPMPRRVSWQSKPKSPESLTPQQEADLLRVLDEDVNSRDLGMALLVRLMLATGLRIGEACAIRWSRIDLDAKTLTVDATLTRATGVGLVLQERTKSSAGYRTISLPDRIIVDLRHHEALWGRAEDDVVLRSPRGQWRDPRNTQQSLKRLLARSGLDAFSSHALRKTAGTKLHRAGVPDVDIADQLGHSDISTTRRYYIGRSKVASADNARHL